MPALFLLVLSGFRNSPALGKAAPESRPGETTIPEMETHLRRLVISAPGKGKSQVLKNRLEWKISGFISCRGVAQPGSAPALGAGGHRFKSCRPDQFD